MSLESNVDNLEIRNADKITFVGTSNTVVDTTTGRLGIGTDTPEDTLHVNGGIRFAGHIIPTTHAAFDVGSAEYKVRDMFVDTNSLWIGDRSKISFSGGKLKFKRRKLNKVPKMVKDLAIAHGRTNEVDVGNHAVAFAHAIDSTITEVADLKLEHWRDYTKTFDSTKAISDIFVDNDEDYEAVTASDAFMEVGSNIFTNHSLSIGSSADPQSNLHVTGDAIITGNLTVDTNTLFVDSTNNRVGIGTTAPTELLDITAASGDYDAFIRLRSGSGGTSPVTESGLKLTESGEYGFQFAHSGATDLLKIRHQNSAGAVDLDDIMVWNPNGNVGIGTDSPVGKLHVQTETMMHITAGTVPAFTGLSASSSTATSRAQLVLSSRYSDLVIASSYANDAHGSTLSFAAVNPSNTAEYRKFVINQGNWGSRKDFLDFGLSASAADPNPHSSINSTDTVLTLDGNNKRVGIGTISPTAKLHVDAGTAVATRITGATQWTNRPFAMMGRNAGRTYAPNVVVCNVTGYNSGIANTSNGRFTAPTGFSGYYLVTFCGLAGIAETGPNDRWYKNGADTGWGSSHVNSQSLVPSRWGMSSQCIIYLNAGDYLEHRVITGSHYGSSQVHSTHIVMYLHS